MPENQKYHQGVYFIYAPNQNKVKVGRSNKIQRRYKQLRTGFMDRAVLLKGIITKDEVKVEAEIHNKFAHLRIDDSEAEGSEWFFVTKELKNFILNLECEFENVKKYNDIQELEKVLTYKTLGMFRLILFLKSLPKHLVSFALILVGGVIAFHSFSLFPEGDPRRYIQMSKLVLYPFIIPWLTKQVIERGTVKQAVFLFSFLALVVLIEVFSNHFDLLALTFIRTVYVSIMVGINFGMGSKFAAEIEREEYENKAIKRVKTLSIEECKRLYDDLLEKYYRQSLKLFKWMVATSIVAQIAFIVLSLILPEAKWEKILLVSISSFGLLRELVFFTINKKVSGMKIMRWMLFAAYGYSAVNLLSYFILGDYVFIYLMITAWTYTPLLYLNNMLTKFDLKNAPLKKELEKRLHKNTADTFE